MFIGTQKTPCIIDFFLETRVIVEYISRLELSKTSGRPSILAAGPGQRYEWHTFIC